MSIIAFNSVRSLTDQENIFADRYDALRSRRPYKEAYSHETTLAMMTDDERSEIGGCDWYGPEIWGVFEKHHLRFKDVYERMQN